MTANETMREDAMGINLPTRSNMDSFHLKAVEVM